MNVELILREPLGERTFAAGDFPVSMGGAGSDVVVPARSTGPLEWLALQDGQLFVQPADAEAPAQRGRNELYRPARPTAL